MPLFLNSIKDYITRLFNEGSENWAALMLSAIGSVLSKNPNSCFNLSGNDDFLSLIKIKSNISLLEAFYSIRDKFFDGNVHDYKIIIETHYSDIWHALKLCESSVGSLTKIKSSIELYDYKVNVVKAFRTLERICTNVINSTGFDGFTLESVIEAMKRSPHGSDEDSEKAYEKNMNNLKTIKKKGFGTFADFVIKLKKSAEKSIENLQKNVKNESAVYIYKGEYNIDPNKLGIKKFSIKKKGEGDYYEDDIRLLKNKIREENEKKSKLYVKEIDKVYNRCVAGHDKVKKLYYEVFYLWVKLKLKCLEKIMEKLKKQRLDPIHFFVFGADECLCSENKTIEDGGVDITSENSINAKGIFKLFCEPEDDLKGGKKVQDILYLKKMLENLKGIYKQVQYLEKSSIELHKTALKIEKEYKSKMGQIKKLIDRCSNIGHENIDRKILNDALNFENRIKEVETLKDLTEALNEYIKYLERVYKFKKEILPGYMALEKSVKDSSEARKIFSILEDEIKSLDFKNDISFYNLKKLLRQTKTKINSLLKEEAKQRKKQKSRTNSARGNSQPPIQVQ